MLKKQFRWLKNNQNTPVVTIIIMIFVATVYGLISNLVQGKPVLTNMDFVLSLILMYSGALFLNRYIHQTWMQLTLSFLVAFILLTIQMFSDGSYVDYTSFIVTAFVALFMALMMLLVTKTFSKMSKKH